MRFETNLLDYIGQQDFPTAKPIRNREGQAVSLYRGRPCVLFEYVEGEPIQQPTPEQQRQIVQTAARLQILTRRYRPRLRRFRWNYSPALCRELVQAEARKLGSDARAKARWFEDQLAALELPASLPKGICHCDYDPSNLLFKEGKLAALLDFDDANYTYLCFDLVNLIDGRAWPHEGAFEPETARRIVQDYTRIRPLSVLEQRHLFDVHKLQILFDGIWYFARGDFYEKRKIDYLDAWGRTAYYDALLD